MNLEAIRTVFYGQSGDEFVDRSKVNIKDLKDVEYWTLEAPKPNSKTLVFQSSDPFDMDYADGLNKDYAFDDGVADEGEDWRPYFSPPSIFYTIDRDTKAARKVLEHIASGEKTLDWRG